MKQYVTYGKIVLLVSIMSIFTLASITSADTAEDITAKPSCHYCGMDRAKFAHSRMYIKYNDESTAGLCSIHCAAIEMMVALGKEPVSVMVGDLNSKQLIDAEEAFWVIGGDKMGVMTKRAKWAFASKDAADSFIKEHGGEHATYETALKAAFEDMYDDINMIRKKRKMKRMKMIEHAQ